MTNFSRFRLVIRWIMLGMVCSFPCTSVLAQGLPASQALNYTSPDLVDAEREIADAQRILEQTRLGITAALELEPSAEFGRSNYTDPETTTEFGFGANIGADFEYQHNNSAIHERTIDLLEAQDSYENAQRNGVRDALLSFVDLLRTQLDFEAAQANLADSQANLAELEANSEADEIALSRARFEVELDQSTFDQSQLELDAVTREAAEFGFEGALDFQPLVFLLPEVKVEDTYPYQIAELELAVANQSSVFNVLTDVSVNADYASERTDFTGRLFLEEAGPGFGLSGDYHPFDITEESKLDWSVGLSATFRFDTSTLNTFAEDERALEDARTRLQEVIINYQEGVAEALEAVAIARQNLALEQKGFEVSSQIVEELNNRLNATFLQELSALEVNLTSAQQQLEYYQERVNTETNEETRRSLNEQVTFYRTEITDIQEEMKTLGGQIQRTQQDLDRTNAELGRRVDDIYGLWGTYVTRVHAYLTLVEEPWRLE